MENNNIQGIIDAIKSQTAAIQEFGSKIDAFERRISHATDRVNKLEEHAKAQADKNNDLFTKAANQAGELDRAVAAQGSTITAALDRITKLESTPPKTWKDTGKAIALGGLGALGVMGVKATWDYFTGGDDGGGGAEMNIQT